MLEVVPKITFLALAFVKQVLETVILDCEPWIASSLDRKKIGQTIGSTVEQRIGDIAHGTTEIEKASGIEYSESVNEKGNGKRSIKGDESVIITRPST